MNLNSAAANGQSRRAGRAAWLVVLGLAIALALVIALWAPGAREKAAKSVSRANLHSWGTVMLAYRSQTASYPDSLFTLISKGYVNDSPPLVDQRDNDPEPIDETEIRTSYVYVGPIPPDAPEDTIIAYTRNGLWPGGRFVLYANRERGEVEWVSEADLHAGPEVGRRSLHNSYEKLIDTCGGELSEERRAQLKRFYEVE